MSEEAAKTTTHAKLPANVKLLGLASSAATTLPAK